MDEKAEYKFLKILAKVYVDEVGEVFDEEDWDDDVDDCKKKVLARTGYEKIGSIESNERMFIMLTNAEVLKRQEKVRQDIRDQARDSEPLLELARQIDDLKSEVQELKRARIELEGSLRAEGKKNL